jgi:hypothetical protein
LVDLLEDEKKVFSGEFAVRLERMVQLLEILPKYDIVAVLEREYLRRFIAVHYPGLGMFSAKC